MCKTATPSHHILCAGDYSISYARLSAECLARVLGCKIFIHLDGLKPALARDAAAWFSEIPDTHPTFGLFGIKAGEKIPGRWHQRMVNRVCETFRSEPALAIVDADFFLTRREWADCAAPAADLDVSSVAYRMRKHRSLLWLGRKYSPINTILFTLRPQLHLDLNSQDRSQDKEWIKHMLGEFPGSSLDPGEQIDSMMHASWRAQALGYRVVDLEDKVLGCHVGGFSHMKPSKLTSTGNQRLDTWVQRVRLSRRVWDFMRDRQWTPFLSREMGKTLEACEATAAGNAGLREKMSHLAPSHDEDFWPEVEALFNGSPGTPHGKP